MVYCGHASTGKERDLCSLQGRWRAVWGDRRYLDWSQSGCILPVLAHCCAQTNRLWILSKWQADCPPHQQPVFPTGKWPPVAKGRAFRETTKFYTHMIHMANNSGKPEKHWAFTTAWDGQVAELPLPPPPITYTAHLQRSRGWWATFASWAGQTGSNSHWREGEGCGESCIAVLRNDCAKWSWEWYWELILPIT